jgi:hypothetical protein
MAAAFFAKAGPVVSMAEERTLMRSFLHRVGPRVKAG